MVIYVPGTEETDPKKQNMSLQQLGAAVTANQANIATNAANIITIGNYVESVVSSGSAVALTSGAQKTVTSIPLPIGDWDVDAICYHLPAATTSVTRYVAEISLTNNTITATPGRFSDFSQAALVSGGNTFNNAIPPYRFNVAVATTIFLVGLAVFSVSTLGAYGLLRARRAALS